MPSNISILQRTRLFLFLLIVFLGLPALAAGTWLIYKQSVADKIQMLSERAPLVVQLIENDVIAKKQALQNAALLLDVEQVEQITQDELDGIVENFSGVIWAGVTDTQGKVHLAYKDMLKGADVSKRPWFKQGLEKTSVLDRHDAVLLANLLPKRDEPYRFIDIAVPVKSKTGKALGVLALHLDWVWYQEQFPVLIGNTPDAARVVYAVFGWDNELRLLKASGEDEALLVHEDFRQAVTMKLHDDFYFVRQAGPRGGVMDELDWTLYVMQSKEVTRGAVMSSGMFGLIAFLVGIFAATLLFLRLSKRVSNTSSAFVDALVNRSPERLERLRPEIPREILPLSTRAETLISGLNQQRESLELALEEARASHLEIQRLVAQAPVAIAMFDLNMNYMVCSDQWRSTYLPDIPDPIGQCHYALIPGIPEHWKAAHQQGMRGETLHAEDDCWVDANGKKLWLNWNIQPWTTPENRVGGLILITEDVTTAN